MQKGDRVATIVQKTGQTPRIGRVREVQGDFVEVEWEDGHVSTITKTSLRPLNSSRSGR